MRKRIVERNLAEHIRQEKAAYTAIIHKTVELEKAKAEYESAKLAFDVLLAAEFPGCDEWDWLRAVAHVNGDNCRRNEDTSQDEAMAAHVGIRAAWDRYIAALHVFYALRDGPHGFLGGRERA